MELNPPIEVWCLFIDKDHNLTFGEPFPVLIRDDQTTHDLKTKIYETPHSPKSQPHMKFSTNQIEIWKGKSFLPMTPSVKQRASSQRPSLQQREQHRPARWSSSEAEEPCSQRWRAIACASTPKSYAASFPLLHVMSFTELPSRNSRTHSKWL